MLDEIKKYFWLYLAFFTLAILLFHSCATAIDKEAVNAIRATQRHHTETQAVYVTEAGHE